MNTETNELSCMQVINEVSNFIDDGVDPSLRIRIATHLAGCLHCSAIYDGTRNVVTLVADDHVFELPQEFSARLYSRLKNTTK